MIVGYMRVSKADGSQVLDLQRDALVAAGADSQHLFHDLASGAKDDRPGLAECLRYLRPGDILVVWKLDRLGRSTRHLINTLHDLAESGIGFRVLTGAAGEIDTTTPIGRVVVTLLAALAEYERDLLIERTNAGIAAARARGREGGAKFKVTAAQLRALQSAMKDRTANVSHLAEAFGISRHTVYQYLAPNGTLRERGRKLLLKAGQLKDGE